jgi:hypothetical protein
MVMQIHKHNYVCACVGRGSRVGAGGGGGQCGFLDLHVHAFSHEKNVNLCRN